MAGRKLKVFQAQFGFYDTVVAAPTVFGSGTVVTA